MKPVSLHTVFYIIPGAAALVVLLVVFVVVGCVCHKKKRSVHHHVFHYIITINVHVYSFMVRTHNEIEAPS